MNVAEMIEWLKTMPQDAKVTVLTHSSGYGYYDQGGNCYITDFNTEVEHKQCKDEGDTSPVEYAQGVHFELSKYQGAFELQIGVKDK